MVWLLACPGMCREDLLQAWALSLFPRYKQKLGAYGFVTKRQAIVRDTGPRAFLPAVCPQ